MERSTRTRAGIALMVGAACVAGVASVTVVTVLQRLDEAARAAADRPVETVKVVAASRTLYQGVGITPEDLFVVTVPVDTLPLTRDPANARGVVPAAVFSARERVVGQIPRERILVNEIVRPERLADGSVGEGLNALVPRGMRAMSVGLKGADAVHGFLTPGNYVDVLVTMKDELGERRTETVLQAVFVLGVNSRAEQEDVDDVRARGAQAPSVTFLVTPTQAEDIAYADELGALGLTLRHPQDVAWRPLDGVSMDEIVRRVDPRAGLQPERPRVEATLLPRTPRGRQDDGGGLIRFCAGPACGDLRYEGTSTER
ncbi:MAG: Flp pilus assembly protein CpaB [Alphaproteobacteria bacterium]|nr:Flp pilus assembly protein CpaB [Alphaproteobacteria bacterium]